MAANWSICTSSDAYSLFLPKKGKLMMTLEEILAIICEDLYGRYVYLAD
jgi:hypothetical protein